MISKLEIANTPKKDNNITFTKDQEIAVHKLIEFLAQPWDDKSLLMLFVALAVLVKLLLLNMLLIIVNGLIAL